MDKPKLYIKPELHDSISKFYNMLLDEDKEKFNAICSNYELSMVNTQYSSYNYSVTDPFLTSSSQYRSSRGR